ncbi:MULTISPECIES: aldehyde dehydrogenase [unclassified Clostridioides]|uniref:aldehyde dehydrogenase n=1 Tax=unclassified Clostridioides TaxID=2635829 RepID=UPI001D11070E|nr:aldehyde dehydrogenase [Clostridioides sp. ES-S-0171-01]MCC0687856.1 aldehyde dehydrogenase [Clostridioides sp. ES-S-0056-01]MCC0714661.1 aldehyde dehydrogenase [Clostridioides sp. ES-S-0077-01]UDN53345.1 aldehyde dehydrogenase [Clostridioides sp. ES-S-0054-01]
MEINELVMVQRKYYNTGKTRDISFRLEQLKKLKSVVLQNEEKILLALKKDLNKSDFEGFMTEVGMFYSELDFAIKNIRKWSKIKRVSSGMVNFPSISKIIPQPYGVTLIMSPWNYPFQLALIPLVWSLAAGNCVILKPSEYSVSTSSIVKDIIENAFSKEYIAVVQGSQEESEKLLLERFDYIFFTGSTNVGRIVMKSASEHLTPITLELGGKSPCIILKDADIDLTAKRLTWGKLINAGQTCVAPDYILVHEDRKEELIEKIKYYINKYFGDNPCNNEQFPKIINEKHFNRILSLIDNDKVVYGGNFNKEILKIEPTIVDNTNWDDDIMKEEIFGPIFPILSYKDLDEVVKEIIQRPNPLALYIFTKNKHLENKLLEMIPAGGCCINDTIIHIATNYLPFGGVGESGMGSYHGKAGFDTFTHYKSVLKKLNLDVPIRYAPYDNKLIKILKKIM